MCIALYAGILQLIFNSLALISLSASEWALEYFSWAVFHMSTQIDPTLEYTLNFGLEAFMQSKGGNMIKITKWDA